VRAQDSTWLPAWLLWMGLLGVGGRVVVIGTVTGPASCGLGEVLRLRSRGFMAAWMIQGCGPTFGKSVWFAGWCRLLDP